MSAEMLPCPFCETIPSTVQEYKRRLYVFCHVCKAQGPVVGFKLDGPDAAIAAWNRRAPLPAEQPSNPVPHPEITPMFLLNAAMCIESPGDCSTRSKREILAKLHRLSAELQDERMARIVGQQTKGGGE